MYMCNSSAIPTSLNYRAKNGQSDIKKLRANDGQGITLKDPGIRQCTIGSSVWGEKLSVNFRVRVQGLGWATP